MNNIHDDAALDKGESEKNTLAEALHLAEQGFRIFPGQQNGKSPALPTDWRKIATGDRDSVRERWTCPVLETAHNYNVCVATGDGLVVLDTDVRAEKDGETALAELERRLSPLPRTRTVRTPSGGRHRYFRTSRKIASSANKLAPGVDVRGENGYVVAAGSIAGRHYVCEIDEAVAELPEDWAIELAPVSPHAAGAWRADDSSPPLVPNYDVYPADARAQARTFLDRASVAVSGDGGNNTTYWVACEVKDRGVATPLEALDVMGEWNDRCSPPWQADDLLRIIESAYKTGKNPIGSKARVSPEAEFDSADEVAVGEPASDLGNARRLVRTQGIDLRFVHAWNSWLHWDGSHWRRDEDGAAMRLAKAAVESMHVDARKINDENRRTVMRKHALASQSAARLSAMLSLAESEPEVLLKVSEIDADPMLLGVANGVVDLRTGEFREARRSDYITKIAGTEFDPAARCPNWRAFLRTILPDDEIVRYLQRACGYVLTGLTGEEVLFVLLGEGLNGKSTFREVLFKMMGDYAVGSDASLLVTGKRSGGATPDLVRLLGRRFVAINETEKDDVLNEARVKYITSHDKITARNLYESFFDFTPTHKTFLTTNHKPIVKNGGEGTWRRIHLLPFLKKIEKPDPGFRERKLIPELPGILNWAIEGALAYHRDGLAPPQAVLNATDEYREDMDLIGRWISERCEVDPDAATPTAGLHADYEAWARTEVGFTMSTVGLGRALVARGFASVKTGGSRRIKGIRLKSPLGRDFAAVAGATGRAGADGTDKEAFCANFMD